MKKPWKVISNDDGVDDNYATLSEALKEADKVLSLWREQATDDGEWDEDVEGVEVHLVTHAARITTRDGDNEYDGVEYGMTEILGNEIDEELGKLRAKVELLMKALAEISDLDLNDFNGDHLSDAMDIAREALAESVRG